MIVYSERILHLIRKLHRLIEGVLTKELGYKVRSCRFVDHRKGVSYPIKVVIHTEASRVGWFDPNFYELGFHESLLVASEKTLLDVVRHELAHYKVFIEKGNGAEPHGKEFKAVCEKLGWGRDVSRASLCISEEEGSPLQESSTLLRKIQKLLALSTSSNEHEAQLAMMKSQQLLLKHNLDQGLLTEEGESVFLIRLLHQKKIDGKLRAIGKILETFFVSVVYHKGRDGVSLEVVGTKVNVEIAEYVARVLQGELERLWEGAKDKGGLSGSLDKNSFFWGVSLGYCQQVEAFYQQGDEDLRSQLVVIQDSLQRAQAMAYPKVSERKGSVRYNRDASNLGKKAGKELKIRQAVQGSSKGFFLK